MVGKTPKSSDAPTFQPPLVRFENMASAKELLSLLKLPVVLNLKGYPGLDCLSKT
jgi:hypothetical protein